MPEFTPRPRRVFRSVVALAFVALPLLLAATAARAQTDTTSDARRPLIMEVALRGVKNVDLNQLRAGLVTKGSTCKSPLYLPLCWISRSPLFTARHHLDPLEFRRDVLRVRLFYWQRGWRDVAVVGRTEKAGPGVRAIFEIEEKEPTIIQSLSVTQTDSVLPQQAIDRALQLKAGDPLDLIALDSTILFLRDELWERGHAGANIVLDTTQVSDVSNGGPVSITIEPGPLVHVSGVEFAGNEKVSDETIHRLLTFKKGDLFKRSAILGSQQNLYLSGLFTELDVETPPVGDSLRLVRIRVIEADLNRLELAAGVTTADFGQVDADFSRYNFFGSARHLALRTTVSNLLASSLNGQGIFYDVTDGANGTARDEFLKPTWSISASITQPWLFSIHNQLGISVFAHRRTVPGIAVERGEGASIAFTRDFGPRTNSTLGYTYEVSRINASDVYFCVSFGVCLAPLINVLADGNVLSPVASVTQFDVTNDPFTPDRGYRARIDLEHASGLTASDFRYNRAEFSGSTYRSMSRTAVLAVRGRLGWVGAGRGTNAALGIPGVDDERVIHPRKRFYAGGSLSVRGFGERQLGPRVLTVSPTALTDTALAAPCTTAQLQDGSCDPNIAGLGAGAFQPQPLGGTAVAEFSVEYRFPLWPVHGISAAVFLDGAVIGTNQLSDLLGATGSITPGFGIRMDTPVGPVRLDLGVRPTLVEDLPVVTQVSTANGAQLVTLHTTRRYDPLDARGGFLNQIFSRLRLHLAIGPPF
jgi:outer membrane protein assembly factor BamA